MRAVGAPCAPDSQAPIGPVSRDEIGEHQVAEGIEVFLVAKEVGFADRDLRDQFVQLEGAAKGITQNFQVGGAVRRAYY